MIEQTSVRLSVDDELDDLEAQIEDLRSEIDRTAGRAVGGLRQQLAALEARLRDLTRRTERVST